LERAGFRGWGRRRPNVPSFAIAFFQVPRCPLCVELESIHREAAHCEVVMNLARRRRRISCLFALRDAKDLMMARSRDDSISPVTGMILRLSRLFGPWEKRAETKSWFSLLGVNESERRRKEC
jgi:hypothetical protein